MITAAISRMDDRMDAIYEAIKSAQSLEPYVKSRSYVPHASQQKDADLKKGVLMLISNGEGGYSREKGQVANKGAHEFMLICHFKVADTDKPETTEAFELDMAEDIKTFVRAGVPGMTLYLDNIQNSWQQDHPYGWLAVKLTAGSPGHSIN